MPYVTIFSRDFTVSGANLTGLTQWNGGASEYAVTNTVGLKRTGIASGVFNPLFPTGSADALRHRVTIVFRMTALGTSSTGLGDAQQVAGCDHIQTANSWYLCGFMALDGNQNDYSGAITNNTAFANITLAGAIPGGAANTDYTLVYETTAAVDSDHADVSVNVASAGAVTGTTTGQGNNSHVYNAGKGGFYIFGTDFANVVVKSVLIEEWQATSPLTIATATGEAVIGGTSVAPTLSIAGATTSGGGTVTRQWYLTTDHDETGATEFAVPGVAGTATDLTAYALPSQFRGVKAWAYQRITDGTTTFAAQGYLLGQSQQGGNGVYVPFYAPSPTVPNTAALTALFSNWAGISGGLYIPFLGDSLTHNAQTAYTNILTAIGATGVTSDNFGHSGSSTGDWLPTATATGTGEAQTNGTTVTGVRNIDNFITHCQAAVTAGKKVIIPYCLGTNKSLDATTDNANYDTITAYILAQVPTANIVVQDLGYYYGRTNNILDQFDAMESHFHASVDASSSDHLYPGTRLTRPYMMANAANTTLDAHVTGQGITDWAALQMAAVLTTLNALYPAPGSPTVSGVSVSPSTATVAGLATQQFSATVAGTGSPSQAVNWGASAGSISSSGLFVAPAATSSPQTITITATSVADNTKSGTATVTVPAATSSGGGGGGSVRLVRGEYRLTANLGDIDGIVTAFVGDRFGIVFRLEDENGEPVPLGGSTQIIAATVTATGTVLSNAAATTLLYGAGGLLEYTLQVADTATAGREQITITLTDTATGEVQTFGPVTLRVRDR